MCLSCSKLMVLVDVGISEIQNCLIFTLFVCNHVQLPFLFTSDQSPGCPQTL